MAYATPTGGPCPRCLRLDGTVEGTGACTSCGCCLLLAEAAWPGSAPEGDRLQAAGSQPDGGQLLQGEALGP